MRKIVNVLLAAVLAAPKIVKSTKVEKEAEGMKNSFIKRLFEHLNRLSANFQITPAIVLENLENDGKFKITGVPNGKLRQELYKAATGEDISAGLATTKTVSAAIVKLFEKQTKLLKVSTVIQATEGSSGKKLSKALDSKNPTIVVSHKPIASKVKVEEVKKEAKKSPVKVVKKIVAGVGRGYANAGKKYEISGESFESWQAPKMKKGDKIQFTLNGKPAVGIMINVHVYKGVPGVNIRHAERRVHRKFSSIRVLATKPAAEKTK